MACCYTCSTLLLLQALLHKGLSYVPSAFCLKEVFQGVAGMEGVKWIVVWDTCGLMKDLWVAEQVGTRVLHTHHLWPSRWVRMGLSFPVLLMSVLSVEVCQCLWPKLQGKA